MEIIKKEKRMCPYCRRRHEIWTVIEQEQMVFHDIPVYYDGIYLYCNHSQKYSVTNELLEKNKKNLMDAYEKEKKMEVKS